MEEKSGEKLKVLFATCQPMEKNKGKYIFNNCKLTIRAKPKNIKNGLTESKSGFYVPFQQPGSSWDKPSASLLVENG